MAHVRTLARISITCLALFAAACGDESNLDPGADAGPDAADGLEAAPRDPVLPDLADICVLDIDCAPDRFCFLGVCASECSDDGDCGDGEVCSAREQCLVDNGRKSLDADGTPAAPEYAEGVRIVELPERTQPVDPGLEEILVPVRVDGPVPDGGIGYRVETAELGSGLRVRRARMDDDDIVWFAVPTGPANPLAEEPTAVDTNVVSSIGSFRVTLIPRPPVGGTFAGEARVEQLGNMAVPIHFMIATDPVDASLEAADAVWLLLPVGPDELLSPHELFDETAWSARPLTYDAFTETWVARFDNEFRFGDDTIFGSLPDGQVGRSIRFELTPGDSGVVTGTFSDRWTGLYDERSESGVLEQGVVTFAAQFEARRFGDALAPGEFETAALDPPSPRLLPLPPLDACDNTMFAVDPVTIDEVEYSCAGITTLAEFASAEAEPRASCAVALAEDALAGETTADLLAQFLDGDDETPGGESFADFMERCASGVDGACRPSDETLCARQAAAFAYVQPEDDVTASARLVEAFEDTTREAFLGRQLGAFQTNANLRLDWLRTSDYPAIVTSAVQELNETLLAEWVSGVLDVHFEVLAGQFDPSGIAVLARQPADDATIARRRQLLFELTQGWRAAMESLVLGTQRWNALLRDPDDRAAQTTYVAARMNDLYVLAGVAGNLNRAAGSGFANGAFSGGFGALRREVRKLELPFSELVYARDAEVVVSTSLDPQSDGNTVLGELREQALAEINASQDSVGSILAEAEARALSENQLRNQLDNDLDEARAALVELCGLPVGCGTGDFPDVPECAVRIVSGECGFAIDRYTGELENYAGQPVTTSDAGRAMLAVLDASNNYNVVESEANAHYARSARAYEDAEAFAMQIEDWNARRQETYDEIEEITAERHAEWTESLDNLVAGLAERERLRATAINAARDAQDEWETVEAEGRRERMATRVFINGLQASAAVLRDRADDAMQLGEIAKEGFPTVVGTSNDTTSAGRVAVLMAAFASSKSLQSAATAADASASALQAVSDARQRANELRIRDIQQEAEFADREYEAAIAALQDEADALEVREGARDSEVDRLIAALERAVEVELAYERDKVELRDRTSVAWGMLQDNSTMLLRTVQAQFQIQQRVFEYLEIVQRAELLQSRINQLESQQQNVNLLLGSPAVVFAWANRLEQAELRLERAKSALMDWLVAMEYFAVRPFMDQRIQILLARNPYQLEAIAAEMQRLERACGGPQSEQSSTVRLTSLLGIADTLTDLDEAVTYSPAEQLRAVFERGAVPVDTRTRYTPEETIGDLLDRGAVWAATVSLDLARFANLAATCNAKVVSLDVRLVGTELGDARPTVTILYDGLSQLRSCQPGISEYVASFGPEATSFGSVTTFRTPPQSISPVAGIDAFPSETGGTGNLSLAGLPLSSQYTVLIDRELGENRDVDWGRLEDIELRVNYAYQDPFPAGRCE